MNMPTDPLEILWDALLSRNPPQITGAFRALDPESRKVVLAHLQKMASEDGWHSEQVASAKTALAALMQIREP